MTDTNYDALRERMDEHLAALARRHGVLEKHLRRTDRALPDDWGERAAVLENDEVLEGLESAAANEVKALAAALRRLEAGTFGKCTGCGRNINPKRLQAMPESPLCIRCAAAREAG